MHDFEQLPQHDVNDVATSKGRVSSQSAHSASAYIEDSLPLYEPPHSASIDTLDTLPPMAASPAVVRAYIADLLVAHGGIEICQAHDTAAKWNIGSGHELRKYPAAMYREIFGVENSWVIYRLIRLRVLKEERAAAKPRLSKRTMRAGGSILLLIAASLMPGGFAVAMNSSDIGIGLLCFVLAIPMYICGAIGLSYKMPDPVEDVVSRELVQAYSDSHRQDRQSGAAPASGTGSQRQ